MIDDNIRNVRLDWISRHDERSRNFSIAPMTSNRGRPGSVYWGSPKENIDQGREGACVGFAWTNRLLALPSRARLPMPANDFARNVYRSAQKIDEWEGEAYSGTSVLAGAKVIKMAGFISEYRWAFSISDILDGIAFAGPVVLGIPWFDSMYETTSEGLVEISGTKVGGHAITATGYGIKQFWVPSIAGGKVKKSEEVIRWRNSWGPRYGIKGDGYIRTKDLKELLSHGGEACIPIIKGHK